MKTIKEEGFLDDYGKAVIIGGSLLGTVVELLTRILGHLVELKELSNENPKIKNLIFPEITKVEEKVKIARGKVAQAKRQRKGVAGEPVGDKVTPPNKYPGVVVDTSPQRRRR